MTCTHEITATDSYVPLNCREGEHEHDVEWCKLCGDELEDTCTQD